MGIKGLLRLEGNVSKKQSMLLGLGGILFFILIWTLLTTAFIANPDLTDPELVAPEDMTIEEYRQSLPAKVPMVPRAILPHPVRVLSAFKEAFTDRDLIRATSMSMALNLGGYLKAILWAIPLGFLIGLIPLFNHSFRRIVDSIRFIPLTALISLFIIWFGIGSTMKMNFLAFGIFIYLLPVVVQRLMEVEDVYLKTVHTLGASDWQKIKTVYFPSVMSKLIDDVRVLTAISWTYIIVIEIIAAEKGLGSLIYSVGQRRARVDIIFAILVLIMLIGIFQDRVFLYLDRKLFPYKYQVRKSYDASKSLKEITAWDSISDFTIRLLGYIFMGIYILLAINEWVPFLGGIKPLSYLFGDRIWVIHVLFFCLLLFVFRKYLSKLLNR